MAATKRNAMLIAEARFYVYQLSRDGIAVYVGKGSGSRLAVQMRRYGLPGEIVRRFARERDAYAFERQLIASAAPEMNRHPGGNGSRATRQRAPRWVAQMTRIGTRAYAARLLLNVASAAPGLVEASNLERLRLVAYGCRV